MECTSPSVPDNSILVDIVFVLDNVRIPYSSVGENFTYQKNPVLKPLNRDTPSKPYSLKPGNVLDIEVKIHRHLVTMGSPPRLFLCPPGSPLLSVYCILYTRDLHQYQENWV